MTWQYWYCLLNRNIIIIIWRTFCCLLVIANIYTMLYCFKFTEHYYYFLIPIKAMALWFCTEASVPFLPPFYFNGEYKYFTHKFVDALKIFRPGTFVPAREGGLTWLWFQLKCFNYNRSCWEYLFTYSSL